MSAISEAVKITSEILQTAKFSSAFFQESARKINANRK